MERTEEGENFTIGSSLPTFSLPATDGNTYTQDYFRGCKAALVVFTCNHCPYVKGSDDELLSVLRTYQDKGLKALLINSNDPAMYPDDDFEHMRAKADALCFPFPYCFDEAQETARAFDAECTPECFLFDEAGTYVFHGSVNDSPREPGRVTKRTLDEAISTVLAGKKPDPAFTSARGCSIKWKRGG